MQKLLLGTLNRCRFDNLRAAGIEQGSPKRSGLWPACRAGDLGSPRKAAGAVPGTRGLPVKARLPPQKNPKPYNWLYFFSAWGLKIRSGRKQVCRRLFFHHKSACRDQKLVPRKIQIGLHAQA